VSYFGTAMQALGAELAARDKHADPDLLRLYTLLVLTTGTGTTAENVHDAWSAWRILTRPDHPALKPFAELSPEVAELDQPYADAICAASLERGSE
jgi:hypothetical protein